MIWRRFRQPRNADRFCRDEQGATAVEMALTAPVFCLVLFGLSQTGLLVWTSVGLQRGVEMAARCASINPARCPNTEATKAYASEKTMGLSPPTSVFTVTVQACGTLVTADQTLTAITSYVTGEALRITARACFPR